ncbi:TPR domain-containing glycosyltransferase [Paenibacillus silviterrae]|uniref:TPR domain-containing glycosyltransferase n=1 Tax=Paenibacillus silviterrae TaxID=3242194 RepID=UPI0025427755|nr:TPR domain-containing glycosyltransferase [Paenibacillus chinjuensis]
MTKKLSICMIVKDEEKNLPRCLDSLSLLLDKPYTELIIVDTGSKDKTVDIAKCYTDRVYYHEWNGNFSSMRNISISYAVGEWIFIIDADEELETPEIVSDLFESDVLNKYNTVQVKERNLVSVNNQKFINHVQERLFKNDGSFKYEGSVHNQPLFREPILQTEIWLMHYGYVNEDKQLMNKKFERTAAILKKELQKDPDNIYYRFQLSRSYAMTQDFLSAYKEVKHAYHTLMKKNKNLIVQHYYVFGEFARMSFNVNRYNETIQICDEGMNYKKNSLDLCFFKGHAQLLLNRTQEGIQTLIQYLNIAVKYWNKEIKQTSKDSVELYSLDEPSYNTSLDRVITIIYQRKNLEKADSSSSINKQFFEYIRHVSNNSLKYNLLIKVAFYILDYNSLYETYMALSNEEKLLFITQLEILKKDITMVERTKIEEVFSNADNNYALLNKLRTASEIKEKQRWLSLFLNKFSLNDLPREQVIELMIFFINFGDIKKLLKQYDNQTVKNIVIHLVEHENKEELFVNILSNELNIPDYQNLRLYISIANIMLLRSIEKNNNIDFIDADLFNKFLIYVNKGIEYITCLYNLERIRITYETLTNNDDKFFCIMYLANNCFLKGDTRNFHKYILEATNEYPHFSTLLKSYVLNMLKND